MQEKDQYQHDADTRESSKSGKKGQDVNKQLKELWQGTTRVGASLGTVFANMADIFSGRDHVLMVRVNEKTLEKVDQLVEAGMFKSRSESTAYLIARGINTDSELFERINEKVSEISKLRDELRDIVGSSEEPGTE